MNQIEVYASKDDLQIDIEGELDDVLVMLFALICKVSILYEISIVEVIELMKKAEDLLWKKKK